MSVHLPKICSIGWFAILAMVGCVFPLGTARASSITDVGIALQAVVGSGSDPGTLVTFTSTGTLSMATGQFTVGDYTISNITAEFVGTDFSNVTDPLQFRLTGMDSITCTICSEPLEIDFGAFLTADTQSGAYLDQTALGVTVAMDGSLAEGNEVAADLFVGFVDGSFVELPVTLHAGLPFSAAQSLGIATGNIDFMGGFSIGCGCIGLLQPGQALTVPDSISITFTAPEPATWMLSAVPLALLALVRRRKRA